MRAIVYDTVTAEPITAIKLKPAWLDYLKSYGQISFAYVGPISVGVANPSEMTPEPIRKVTLNYAVGVTPAGVEFPMLFTDQGELALGLEPIMLAGQNRLLQKAFERGFETAVSRIFG